LEAYVIAREKEAKAAWDRGELPFLEGGTAAGIYDLRRLQIERCGGAL
jgi:hypothetical protein